jgi:hypothetical protein
MHADDRTSGTLLFDVKDRTVKAGETFSVYFTAAEQEQGYQFTLGLKDLEVVDVKPGEGMNMDNFGVFDDAITTSFDGKQIGAFSVTFRAKADGHLSSMIGVSSRITKAQAYPTAQQSNSPTALDVALRFNGNTIAGVGFELYQNTPNPWEDRTTIGFHLPEATSVTLTIFDETGRTLYTQKGDFAKGYNAFTLKRTQLDASGVLYYKVETATGAGTMKMIQTE